jgi:hypothetical protein
MPNYADKGENETISGQWDFADRIKLDEPTISGTGNGIVSGSNIGVDEFGEPGTAHRTFINFANHQLPIVDGGATGASGSTLFYTFPEGHILILGMHLGVSFIAGDGGIEDDAAMLLQIKSGSEVLASSHPQLSGGSGGPCSMVRAQAIHLDGTSSSAALSMNISMADGECSANDTLGVIGNLNVLWIHLGDN